FIKLLNISELFVSEQRERFVAVAVNHRFHLRVGISVFGEIDRLFATDRERRSSAGCFLRRFMRQLQSFFHLFPGIPSATIGLFPVVSRPASLIRSPSFISGFL